MSVARSPGFAAVGWFALGESTARREAANTGIASRTVFGIHREETSIPDAATSATRLAAIDDLDQRQVTVAETPQGPLAVGISDGSRSRFLTAVGISSPRSGKEGSLVDCFSFSW